MKLKEKKNNKKNKQKHGTPQPYPRPTAACMLAGRMEGLDGG
jgi:hypothetical protein